MPAALLSALYTHLPNGLIVVDTARHVLFINEAGTRLSAEVVRATAGRAAVACPTLLSRQHLCRIGR